MSASDAAWFPALLPDAAVGRRTPAGRPWDDAPPAPEECAAGSSSPLPTPSIGGWQHPPSFYCPNSQQCMRDPVVLADGHSYERSYIERWLARSCISPVSGMPFPQKDVLPNHALRNAIEEYFAQVFSVHRRAIRKSNAGPEMQEGLGSNAALLRTIDRLMQSSLLVNADLSTERILQQIMEDAKVFASQAALAIASSEDQTGRAARAEPAEPPGGAGPSKRAAAFTPPWRPVGGTAEGETEEAKAEGEPGRLLALAAASWHFDALELAKRTGNKPLSTLGVHLFDECQLVERCGLDRSKLVRFLTEIERGYDDAHRYHNRSHAASVLHAMHALLSLGGLAEVAARAFWGEGSLERGVPLVTLACLIAAAVHDYEHRGLNNDFLTKTQDQRAVRYNDKNVNEAHHVAAAFVLMRQPSLDFLAELPQEDLRWLRGLCIDLVIATDMANNDAILSSFTAALDASLAPAVAGCDGEASRDAAADRAGFRPAGVQEAVLLLQMAIKCADLGHLALPWDTHVEWLHRLESEFFAQGDLENSLGMQPSFLMDRAKPGASKTQEGFMKFVALPLFSALARAAPSARPMLEGAAQNYERWRDGAACWPGPDDSSASTQAPPAHDELEFCCVEQESPGRPSPNEAEHSAAACPPSL